MSEPGKKIPWGIVALVAPLVLILIGILAIAAGLKGALVGIIAAALVFALLAGIVWRTRLVGSRKSVPVTPSLIAVLFGGMMLVLLLAVLVFVLK